MAQVYSHRQSEYRVTLLDHQNNIIRRLDGVIGGTVSLSSATRLRASGSLELSELAMPIDWMKDRVKIEYVPSGMDPWSLGVFLLSAPVRSYSEVGSSWKVDLSSILAIPDADCTSSSLTISKDVPLVKSAADLLKSSGVGFMSITPSDAKPSADLFYDPGKSKLTIANELLAAAGYWSAHPDGNGAIRLSPYSKPASRPVAYSFSEGSHAIHLPEWDRELDAASVPNRVILISEGSHEKPALVGEATNTNPKSPYSYSSRGGRWITEVQSGVEAADQKSISSQAERRLIELSTPTASISIHHMPVNLWPNDLVSFYSQGHSVRGSVKEIEYSLDPTELVKTKILEVAEV